MSFIKPKTIIITGQPACHFTTMVTSPVVDWESVMDENDSDDSSSGGTRKRKRLTFLSPEEKMVRR